MKKTKHPFKKYEEIHHDYSTKRVSYTLILPANMKMLCALLETSPQKLLDDFMWNLSCMISKAGKGERLAAMEYFIACGYGRELYTEEEIRQMFHELDACRSLYPFMDENAMNSEQMDLHFTWSHMYMQYWFETWYRKTRKTAEENPLKKY